MEERKAESGNRKRAKLAWPIVAAVAAVLFWFAPLFHIVPLQATRQQTTDANFNAGVFVDKLWNERLLKSVTKAVDAATLLAEIKKDPKAARERHGRTLGLSSTYYYCVSGIGRVVAVEKNSVFLALDESGSTPDIVLETGNLFGNAIRDGTGLVKVDDFPNSRDFNDISSELNRRIEERLLPTLRSKAAVGAMMRFTGCAEIADENTDLRPLRIVPLVAEVRPKP